MPSKNHVSKLLILAFCLAGPSASAAGTPAGLQAFVRAFVEAGESAKAKQDLSVLQTVSDNELALWHPPGLCMVVKKTFKRQGLTGWISDVDPLDPSALLVGAFEGLKKDAPVVVLKSKAFNPYKPGGCSTDDEAKKAEWYDKWIVYPGDYLDHKASSCAQIPPQPAPGLEKTLLYFRRNGDNHYFGVKRVDGAWKIMALGVDSDCDA